MNKIIITTESLNAGGAERQIVELVKGLSKYLDLEIYVITLTKDGHYDSVIRDFAKLHCIAHGKEWKSYPTIKKLYSLINSIKPDIIHSYSINDSVLISIMKMLLNFTWINGTIRDACRIRDRRQYEKLLLLRLSDMNIANSRAGLAAYNLKESNRNKVIYNGIDLARFPQHKSTTNNSGVFNIGVVANLSDNKDYYTVIKAMEILKNENILLNIIGCGPKRKEYEELVCGKGLEDKIIFHGLLRNVEKVIETYECGILCSYKTRGEGLPNAILEFMASEKPVIATNVGGVSEIIEEGKNGFMISPENPHELAERIKYLMTNPQVRLKIGRNAKETVIQKFNKDKLIESYINLYKGCMLR